MKNLSPAEFWKYFLNVDVKTGSAFSIHLTNTLFLRCFKTGRQELLLLMKTVRKMVKSSTPVIHGHVTASLCY